MNRDYTDNNTSVTTSFIGMTIQTQTVLQKLCLGIKITTQGTQLLYFENNLSRTSKQAEIYFMNCILIDKVIRRVYQFIDQTVYR